MLYAGIDEVGVSSVAGPMVASVVVLPENHGIKELPVDSKLLDDKNIIRLAKKIREVAIYYKTFELSPKEVDELGVEHSIRRLWKMCALDILDNINNENLNISKIIVDGKYKIKCLQEIKTITHDAIIGADGKYANVSASAIISKDYCDNKLRDISFLYPEYNFAKHKGYPTPEHMENIKKYGLCEFHRRDIVSKIKEKENPYLEETIENLQVCIQEIVDLYQEYPSIFHPFEKDLIVKYYRSIMIDKEKPSNKVQYYLFNVNKGLKSKIYKEFHKKIKHIIGSFSILNKKLETLNISVNINKLNSIDLYSITKKYQQINTSKRTTK